MESINMIITTKFGNRGGVTPLVPHYTTFLVELHVVFVYRVPSTYLSVLVVWRKLHSLKYNFDSDVKRRNHQQVTP